MNRRRVGREARVRKREQYSIVTELQNGICINKAETSAGPFTATSRAEMREEGWRVRVCVLFFFFFLNKSLLCLKFSASGLC